jgi:hypothetical protein
LGQLVTRLTVAILATTILATTMPTVTIPTTTMPTVTTMPTIGRSNYRQLAGSAHPPNLPPHLRRRHPFSVDRHDPIAGAHPGGRRIATVVHVQDLR